MTDTILPACEDVTAAPPAAIYSGIEAVGTRPIQPRDKEMIMRATALLLPLLGLSHAP